MRGLRISMGAWVPPRLWCAWQDWQSACCWWGAWPPVSPCPILVMGTGAQNNQQLILCHKTESTHSALETPQPRQLQGHCSSQNNQQLILCHKTESTHSALETLQPRQLQWHCSSHFSTSKQTRLNKRWCNNNAKWRQTCPGGLVWSSTSGLVCKTDTVRFLTPPQQHPWKSYVCMGRDHSTVFKLVLHHRQMTLANPKIIRTGFTICTGNKNCFLVFKFFFSMTAMVYKLTSPEDCCCMQHWQATPDYLPCLAAFAVTSTGSSEAYSLRHSLQISSEAYSLRHSLQIAFILFITRLIQNCNILCPQSLNLPLLVSSTLFVSTTWQTYIFKDWMNSNRNGEKPHVYFSKLSSLINRADNALEHSSGIATTTTHCCIYCHVKDYKVKNKAYAKRHRLSQALKMTTALI